VIQRIQSIYFLIAALLDAGAFFTRIYDHAMNDPQQWIGLGFSASIILGGLLSLICIFLFSSRNIQLKLSDSAIFFQTIALGWSLGILLTLGGYGLFLWRDAVGVIVLLLSLIGILLARHNIRKDQNLVNSMDRIR
jgi:heme exporter protein D